MAAGDGLISMTPTSIAHSGTSASINADGGVDFSAVTSLSLNGVFTGDYDNYLIVIGLTGSANPLNIFSRLRSSGSDATGSDYTNQLLAATGGTITGSRGVESGGYIADAYNTQRIGETVHVYGPFLTQPTAVRKVNASDLSSASIVDRAWTHSLSTSYDGITLFHATDNFTGTIHVFGYEE